MAFKAPGRVGDSPIVGHGLYVDRRHGAATATGTGELISSACASFLVVEEMRRGAKADAACVAALRRIEQTHALQPDHQVALLAVEPGTNGRWASAALRGGFKHVVTQASRGRFGEAETRVDDPTHVLRAD